MPIYNFRHTQSGEIIEKFLSMSQKEEFLKQNPDYESYIGSPPAIGDPVRLGLKKPDDAFRDKLKDIKRKHYKSNINTF